MLFQVAVGIVLSAAVAGADIALAAQRVARVAEPGGVRVETNEPVPPVEPMQTEIVLPASACRLRLSPEVAQAPSVAPRAGPAACGGEDLVRLEAVVLPDGGKVALSPPAVLRCTMAEAMVEWLRAEIPAVATELGTAVRAVDSFASYDCRGRNNVRGAKMSEHGVANAFDLRGLKLANGKTIDFTDTGVARDLRERVRAGVCTRFTTVLGPGSDRYHENHIHLDLAQRRGGYRICQWDVRDPVQVAHVPLPPARPKLLDPQVVDSNGAPMVMATLAGSTQRPEAVPPRADAPAAPARAAPAAADAAGNAARPVRQPVAGGTQHRTAAVARGREVLTDSNGNAGHPRSGRPQGTPAAAASDPSGNPAQPARTRDRRATR
jgi:hypothetical protein